MAQLSIQREIDLMITTANHYIDYMNKKIHYGQFVELAMREFAKSQVNQNLSYVQNWLQSNEQNTDMQGFKDELLNIEGLLKEINDQVGDIDNKKYHEAKQYFQEQQNNLRAESYNQ